MTVKLARIYALVDAFETPRYIGSTSLDIQKRAAVHHAHRNDADRGNPGLNNWLRSLERRPKAVLLQTVVWADRIKAETHWTRWARGTYGSELLNVLDGVTPTPAESARRRDRKAGHYRPHTPESRAKISEGVRRYWEFRRACDAEQARLEAEMGGKFYRLPRTGEELQAQLSEAV
ncbi:hypothetical protein [Streptomyces sp. NPDC050535]|uniref:hypothetical protein n=1 Tax=Streptomyces sp. NPDC050535 TaxID=3365626 RepID=UPI00379E1740